MLKKYLGDTKGLTLIEVLLSIVILSLIVVPFSNLFLTATRNNRLAKTQYEATAVAVSLLEKYKGKTYSELLFSAPVKEYTCADMSFSEILTKAKVTLTEYSTIPPDPAAIYFMSLELRGTDVVLKYYPKDRTVITERVLPSKLLDGVVNITLAGGETDLTMEVEGFSLSGVNSPIKALGSRFLLYDNTDSSVRINLRSETDFFRLDKVTNYTRTGGAFNLYLELGEVLVADKGIIATSEHILHRKGLLITVEVFCRKGENVFTVSQLKALE